MQDVQSVERSPRWPKSPITCGNRWLMSSSGPSARPLLAGEYQALVASLLTESFIPSGQVSANRCLNRACNSLFTLIVTGVLRQESSIADSAKAKSSAKSSPCFV